MPSNQEFLKALFGNDAQWAHVTDFVYDPDDIPDTRMLSAWKGDYFSRYHFQALSNQYFTISTFFADDRGVARRRKALYRATHVIVLDDVREKLSLEQVSKLPPPTYILETSQGSEQWGYKLDTPALDRGRVENLLDGLVANGLAPDGRDPGMKGVTRYVRLPEGYNLKAKRYIDGKPWQCRITNWSPFNTVTLEELAEPFAVNLDALRREARVDGAAAVHDHPLLQIPDLIGIKEERSDGRFDVSCPWVDEHTGEIDNGSAIFTNADGTIGFKCHHGSCQHRTGKHLLEFIEQDEPGFGNRLKQWQLVRSFSAVAPPATVPAAPPHPTAPPKEPALPPQLGDTPTSAVSGDEGMGQYFSMLRVAHPGSEQQRDIASKLLQAVDTMAPIERQYWQEQVRDVMGWTKPETKEILQSLRQQWYIKSQESVNFFDEVVFVKELNQFYDRAKRIFYSPDAYQNAYADADPEARKQALQNSMVTKVDKLDYAPLQPPVFEHQGIVYGNGWSEVGEVKGERGDVSRYLQHYDVLGWGHNRSHVLKYLAYTIRHPDKKINHMILMGSGEGCGKDWLLYPLVMAMGENHMTIDGEELLSGFHDYVLHTKHLHINEAELGDRKEAMAVSAKLKPLAAAPPDKLRVNQKNIKPLRIRNLLSVTMTTNSQLPFRLNQTSRRIYALWSDLNIRDEYDNVMPEWEEYWNDRWNWMRNGGALAVIEYLRNQVDLSDFDPGKAPPMTDFLRDIRDASKSPMVQTIEEFILRKIGCFGADLCTASDMAETLRAGVITHNDLMYCDHKLFTPVRVGTVMREMGKAKQIRARDSLTDTKVWAIRNVQYYNSLTPKQIIDMYYAQQENIRNTRSLKVVK